MKASRLREAPLPSRGGPRGRRGPAGRSPRALSARGPQRWTRFPAAFRKRVESQQDWGPRAPERRDPPEWRTGGRPAGVERRIRVTPPSGRDSRDFRRFAVGTISAPSAPGP